MGPFSPAVDLSSGADSPLFPVLTMNSSGAAAVAWSADNGAKQTVRAVVRPAGGAFSAPVNIAQNTTDLLHPELGIDGIGDVTSTWPRSDGTHSIVQANGYDAFVPQLSAVSIPATGVVGQPVSFSAGDFDIWPIGPPAFDFGDGSQATGGSVAHVYAARGSYRVTVTATDAAGTPTAVSGTIAIRTPGNFKVGKLTRKRKKGTAKLSVEVDGPGTLTISGKGIEKTTVHPTREGVVKLPIKAVGKALKTLNKTGELKTQAKISFAPEGGPANVQQKSVKLLQLLR